MLSSIIAKIAALTFAKVIIDWWQGRKREQLGRMKERAETQEKVIEKLEKGTKAAEASELGGSFSDRIDELFDRSRKRDKDG